MDTPLVRGHIIVGRTPRLRIQAKDPDATEWGMGFVVQVGEITTEGKTYELMSGFGCATWRVELRGHDEEGRFHVVVVDFREAIESMVKALEGEMEGAD